MKKNLTTRNRLIHLYDPKEEGIGSYDLNYINAYKKEKIKNELSRNNFRRYAA